MALYWKLCLKILNSNLLVKYLLISWWARKTRFFSPNPEKNISILSLPLLHLKQWYGNVIFAKTVSNATQVQFKCKHRLSYFNLTLVLLQYFERNLPSLIVLSRIIQKLGKCINFPLPYSDIPVESKRAGWGNMSVFKYSKLNLNVFAPLHPYCKCLKLII